MEAINQTTSYSPKDWAYVIAATNRQPYGFDWEEFGRWTRWRCWITPRPRSTSRANEWLGIVRDLYRGGSTHLRPAPVPGQGRDPGPPQPDPPRGSEYLLFRYHPFSSRSGLSDYVVFSPSGATGAGFFSADWTY